MSAEQPLFLNRRSTINCRGHLIDTSIPKVMGIINITPDSFYSASRFRVESDIIKRVEDIIEEGGDIVDVGAYSTRPGADELSEQEELDRILPALTLIRKKYPDLIVSVDTFRSNIARSLVKESLTDIINDVSGGEIDSAMFETIAELNVPYIIMHNKGIPQNMQQKPVYRDVVAEVSLWMARKVDILRGLGVNDIIIDPGFGFSKTMEHNFTLFSHIEEFDLFQLPILIGISRKSMIYKLLETDAERALNGSSVLNTVALMKGANILRVHDVKEAVECVKLVSKIKSASKY